ncbi:hypothetical protein ABZ816_32830 [Actinosynnema sp. NPDC047251]|uniref:Putative secreted protein n=1 Tax=Saccharothrix espanaensis (strain ATCC 51144 / DSM 44229 / JCM 9112 / NBRC 15066 / NRRL 15764) TaxID=1179773 RepID=K0JPR8_SACES|nr:hypothetical protein [Saccharothrix espanaensis]CCH27426.1 putative secreted protein [Saccharothrix espanaensis DSM 44229]
MTETEEELRRMLGRQAGRVRSTLSGPAIRARASARRRPLRRFAPLISAAAVLAVVAVSLLLIPRGPGASEPGQVPTVGPTTTTSSTVSPTPESVTTKPEAPSSTVTTSRAEGPTRTTQTSQPGPTN